MELSPRQEDDAFFQDLDALPFEENISPLPGDSGKLLIDAAPHLEHGSLADLSPPKFSPESCGSRDADGLLHGMAMGNHHSPGQTPSEEREAQDNKINAWFENISRTASAGEESSKSRGDGSGGGRNYQGHNHSRGDNGGHTDGSGMGCQDSDRHSIDIFLTESDTSEPWQTYLLSQQSADDDFDIDVNDSLGIGALDGAAILGIRNNIGFGIHHNVKGGKFEQDQNDGAGALGGPKLGKGDGHHHYGDYNVVNYVNIVTASTPKRKKGPGKRCGASSAALAGASLSGTDGARNERKRRAKRRANLTRLKMLCGLVKHTSAILVMRASHKMLRATVNTPQPHARIRKDGGIDLSHEQMEKVRKSAHKSKCTDKGRAYRERMHRIESLMIVAEMARILHHLKGTKMPKNFGSSNMVLSDVADTLDQSKRGKIYHSSPSSSSSSSSSAAVAIREGKPPLHRSRNTEVNKKDISQGVRHKRKKAEGTTKNSPPNPKRAKTTTKDASQKASERLSYTESCI